MRPRQGILENPKKLMYRGFNSGPAASCGAQVPAIHLRVVSDAAFKKEEEKNSLTSTAEITY